MRPVPHAHVLENLTWRGAIKNFDPSRKIPAETWTALEHAAILAPSSFGLQPWKFVVVTDPKVRARLRQHSFNQSQITDASHLLVFCRRVTMTEADIDRHIRRIVAVRSVTPESLASFRTMMHSSITTAPLKDQLSEWAARQVYIALGFFLSACAMMGVDACPMEGFDGAKYDEILGLPKQGYAATVLATAGYRAADDPYGSEAKVRHPHEEVVQHVTG